MTNETKPTNDLANEIYFLMRLSRGKDNKLEYFLNKESFGTLNSWDEEANSLRTTPTSKDSEKLSY